MLGGWASGLSTVAAVIVSLYATHQSRLLTTENITVEFSKVYGFFPRDIFHFVLKVKNKGHVRAKIENVYLSVSGTSKRVNINFLKKEGVTIPYELKQIGDSWYFKFGCFGAAIGTVFGKLEDAGKPTFKHGAFTIETAMRQYSVKMGEDFLRLLQERYSKWQEESESAS